MPLSMTRYQRASSDCLPTPNGRKLYLMRALKEEDPQPSKSHRSPTFLDGKDRPQDRAFPPPSAPRSTETTTHVENSASNRASRDLDGAGAGDVVLRWGQNKRSRGSRSGSGDDSSNGRSAKAQRRGISAIDAKQPTVAMMPRGSNIRPVAATSSYNCRTFEERPSTSNISRLEKRLPHTEPPEKMRKATSHVPNVPAPNGSSGLLIEARNPPSTASVEPETVSSPPATTEKVNLELFEWPRIYISLSRKEKEDDFLAMKGTKLPHRPKKRAKNIDKNLQYCFPGMWLSDLTRGRYEVREKKCAKKRRRGLKGLESMDSDSD